MQAFLYLNMSVPLRWMPRSRTGEDDSECIFLIFMSTPKLFSQNASLVFIPISVWWFPFPCILLIHNISHLSFASWRAQKWYFIIVLICISLTAGRIECLICFAHWLVEFLFLICRNSLCSLDIGPLSMGYVANFIFQSVTCFNFLLKFLREP